MMENKSPFLDTFFLLRKDESITIFEDTKEISQKEEQDCALYFESEFEKERLEFLSDTLEYDHETAVWAAKVLYHSAQLYLIRKNTAKDLSKLIPDFKGKRNVFSFAFCRFVFTISTSNFSSLTNRRFKRPFNSNA